MLEHKLSKEEFEQVCRIMEYLIHNVSSLVTPSILRAYYFGLVPTLEASITEEDHPEGNPLAF